MKALVLKELKSIFCSLTGAFFALAFFLIMGLMLWGFAGSYNIIDNGYADLKNFFSLSPILLAVLIPALTMRLFSEEKRNKTLDILLSRPVSIFIVYLSKFLATFVFLLSVLLCTIIYVYCLYQLAYPAGNIDIGSIIASYASLLLLTCVFIVIGLLGSSLSKNQIVSLIISVLLCLFVFFGFDLFASLFSGKTQADISSLGLSYHYKLMQRGVIQLGDILCIINWTIVFITITFFYIARNKKKILLVSASLIIVFNLLYCFIPNIRFDFTADKRYTLSDYTINQLKESEELDIKIYLTGDLNYGFQRLKDATRDLLTDYKRYARNNINIEFVSPYEAGNSSRTLESMSRKGMRGTILNETDREGKISQKFIYPYATITNKRDTLVVHLLNNITGYTAEEKLNVSIEGLEYEFTDAIHLLSQKEPKSIAFIEGHEEISRTYVYDAEELLSKYYFVNRGQIGNEVGILNDFDAVIIAGPIKKYSESEKYILDQYIMQGGKVLWLIDGAFYSHQELAGTGRSASMKNDVNLDDMLFSYGIRINPDLIQDKQCISTYLISEDNSQSILIPSYYQPLLIPSQDFPVTKNIRDIKAGFASSIDIVNDSPDIKRKVLLTSSANTHLMKVPEIIDFDITTIQDQPNYFDQQYIPVAVSLEGKFNSVFTNRTIPDSVISNTQTTNQSTHTKMIVVSSSDIITNELQGEGNNTSILPMGYDRTSRLQYGNREFIVNAVNWLTGDDKLMELRTKQQQIRTLDKATAFENKNKYAIINICIPIAIMALLMGAVSLHRKKKYTAEI